MKCVSSGATVGNPKSSGPNVGAIAGGVIGGVIFVAAVTFAVWWFWIRPNRRQEEYEEEWEEEDDVTTQKHQFQQERPARHSFASTVMSRASNMIPIAFIPGVTNRDGTGTLGSTATPPVPPIPAARSHNPSPLSSRYNQSAIFFSPGDLRNSAYSNTSSLQNRDTFIGRPSITPSLTRESIASEVYRDDAAANPMPATTVMRARPNMVSVKSSPSVVSSLSPCQTGTTTPAAVSEVDFAIDHPSITSPGGISQASSVYSGATLGKPTSVAITKSGSQKGRQPVRRVSEENLQTGRNRPNVSSPLAAVGDELSDSEFEDEPHARARRSLLRDRMSLNTSMQDTPVEMRGQSSIADSPNTPQTPHAPLLNNRGLSMVIEEASRGARAPPRSGLGALTDAAGKQNPFGDRYRTE